MHTTCFNNVLRSDQITTGTIGFPMEIAANWTPEVHGCMGGGTGDPAGVTLQLCRSQCEQEETCLSFHYEIPGNPSDPGTCTLNSVNQATSTLKSLCYNGAWHTIYSEKIPEGMQYVVNYIRTCLSHPNLALA